MRAWHLLIQKTFALALSCWVLTGSAKAEITFHFIYADATNGLNEGFYDTNIVSGTAQTYGEFRRAAAESGAGMLGSYFYNSATVSVYVASMKEEGVLGSCGSPATGGDKPGFVFSKMAKKILEGISDDTNAPDAELSMAFVTPDSPPWDYGDKIDSAKIDFKDTIIHELTHALGFLDSLGPDGGGNLSGVPAGQPQKWYVFDRFVVDPANKALIDPVTLGVRTDMIGIITNNELRFAGPNAMWANNGKLVELYAPAKYDNGSSGSHVNTNYQPQSVMYYTGDRGLGGRRYMPVESGVMADVGYDVNDPSAPPGVSASQGTYSDKVVLNWQAPGFTPAVSNAVGYAVYRNTSTNQSTAMKLADNVITLSYEDTKAASGATNYYWVCAHYDFGVPQTSLMGRPVIGFAGTGAGPIQPPLATNLVSLVDLVRQSSYKQYLDDMLYTHTGDDRGEGPQHGMAQTNIFNLFASFGLQTALDPFDYQSKTFNNVVGVLPGTTRSNEVYIMGAHYDSVDNPGADDDASGVAAVMEAARVLSQYKFGATLVFIAFDLEERGLVGSAHYANNHRTDDIKGMLSLDMIANNTSGGQMEILGKEAMLPIKLAVSNSVALYSGGLTAMVGGPTPDSDHDSFESLNFQACLLIESGTNSSYHTPTDAVDIPGYIDYAYATKITRAAVGYLAQEAGMVVFAQPAAPLVAQATDITTASFHAVWNSVPEATNYLLQVSTSGGFESSKLVPGFDKLPTATATNWLVSGLNAGADYFYRVQAQTSRGLSDFSSAASLRTLTATTPPAQARLLSPVLHPGGRLTFMLSGDAGKTYQIQTSTDLVNWTHVNQQVGGDTPVLVGIDLDPSEPKRFYRVSPSVGPTNP